MNQEFEQMRHGYHQYDLLHDSQGLQFNDSAALDRAECEVWLDGRRTRADIAGQDKDGNVLWVIEIKRSELSQAAIDHAQKRGIPLFVVDLTQLPKSTEDDPWTEIKCRDYFVLAKNLVRGFYPSVTESYNTKCERRAFGMGPDDHNWSKCASTFTVVRAIVPTKGALIAKKQCSTNVAKCFAPIRPICSSTVSTTSRCTRIRFTGLTAMSRPIRVSTRALHLSAIDPGHRRPCKGNSRGRIFQQTPVTAFCPACLFPLSQAPQHLGYRASR